MARASNKYVCQQCGFESVKWMGRCPDCGAWSSLVETIVQPARSDGRKGGVGGIARAGAASPIPLSQVQTLRDARRATGSAELDRVLGGGLVPGSLVLFAGDPGIGKCLAGTERVLDPTTGSFLPVAEWAETLRPILALAEETHRLSPHPVSAFHDQGVQRIAEIKTRLGRTLRCTPSHPVLTPSGWHAVGDLLPGTRIASPRVLPYFGSETMVEQEVKIIAYVLADGTAQSSITVTNALPEVEADLTSIASYFRMTLRSYAKAGTQAKLYQFTHPLGERADARAEIATVLKRIHADRQLNWTHWARAARVSESMLNLWRRGECAPSQEELQRLADSAGVPLLSLAPNARHRAEKVTPVARLLGRVGLRFTTAKTKHVPQCIFRLPREQVAIFLQTLFTCDGSVYVNGQGQAGISYSTISFRLAQDVQHLLLRFGFVTKLRTKPMTVNGEPYTAYEIQLLGAGQVKRFLSEIGIWGRQEAKAKIEHLPMPSLPSTQTDTIPTGPVFWEHIHEVTGGASFRAISRTVGTVVHPGRPDRPLCRTTVAAIADAYPTPYLQSLAQGDVYWDEIESITPAGEERVYDLTVPGVANFVANDLIVHNSSLLLQVAGHIGLRDGETLYVSAEESAQQVKLRAERFGIETDRLLLLAETDVDAVAEAIERAQPALVVVDSIQTVATSQVMSAPGSVSQVRESTLRLMQVAKRLHVPICIIGHVTKEGTVAGPRTLEHIVDAVLYLEGERFHTYRLLRGVKNRFGATNEVGVFEMCGDGMLDVSNPSGLFLTERHGQESGSAVVVSMEGTRPLLVEVQALATTAAYGMPRITTTGVDRNRLLMLMAVLTKRVGMALGTQDVYVNVAGGFTLDEPAVDLGVAVAVASSFTERRVAPGIVLLGEIGLGGELRPVPRTDARIREAAKLGFERCVLPKGVGPKAAGKGAGADGRADGRAAGEERGAAGIELLHAASVKQAIELALDA